MALTDLLHAIQARADDEIAADRHAVALESDAVIADASSRAEALERELRARAEAEAEIEAGRRRAAARLAAVRRIREAREDAYLALRAELAQELSEARTNPEYPRLLDQLIRTALVALANAVVLRVDPRDEKLARELLTSVSPTVSVDPTLQTWGGVHAVDSDGRSVVNTLEQRLAGAESRLRMLFAQALAADRDESRS